MPRKTKKVVVQKRTEGFTTVEKEIHDRLDMVRPVAERVYRKLTQRVNIKRGDRIVFPGWDQLLIETGIKNRNALSRAITELENVGLIIVNRSYNAEIKRRNFNKYYVVPVAELSKVSNEYLGIKNVKSQVSKSKNSSIKTDTVTSMNGTRMNSTRMNKGKNKKSGELPGDIHKKKDTTPQYQNRTLVKQGKALSAEQKRLNDEEWDRKQKERMSQS